MEHENEWYTPEYNIALWVSKSRESGLVQKTLRDPKGEGIELRCERTLLNPIVFLGYSVLSLLPVYSHK